MDLFRRWQAKKLTDIKTGKRVVVLIAWWSGGFDDLSAATMLEF